MRKHMMMTHWEDGWHFEFPQSNKSSRARNPIPSSSNPLPPPSSWLKCGWNASSFSSFWHFKFPQFNKSSCALTGNINSVPHISITDILHLKDDGIQLRALFSTICGFPHPCKSQYCGIPGSHLECVARDTKSWRYWRYISAIFLAGVNVWAISTILGHFWAFLGHFVSFLGHFLVLIFFGQKFISAIFITFCISGTLSPQTKVTRSKS